jgi:hypothetical protein
VTKILSSAIAIARGFLRFSAKILTESFSEFIVGSGNGIGSVGDVKTNTENIITPTIAMI